MKELTATVLLLKSPDGETVTLVRCEEEGKELPYVELVINHLPCVPNATMSLIVDAVAIDFLSRVNSDNAKYLHGSWQYNPSQPYGESPFYEIAGFRSPGVPTDADLEKLLGA